MNLKKVVTVIKREYMTRVKTKGFIASLFLMPVMMFVIMVVPSLVMMTQGKSDKLRTFVVFDETGKLFPKMQAAIAEDLSFYHKDKLVYKLVEQESDFNGNVAARRELNRRLEAKEIYGYIEIPEDVFESNRVAYYSKSITDFDQQGAFRRLISAIVTNMRIAEKGYSAAEVRNLMQKIHLETFAVSAKGDTDSPEDEVVSEQETGIKLGISYVLVFLLYMFTLMYGNSVMRSVLEEKTTRIVEVIISSVKPHQLLLGKIIGVCAVCLTMFGIWGICAVLLLINISPILGIFGIGSPPQPMTTAIQVIKSVGFSTFLYFGVYFVMGFFIFSTLYAAIGAICNTDEEANQVATPVVMLLVVPFVLMFGLFQSPDSALSVTLSHIPLFSPILMFMRINVLTPPLWEILLNIVVMIFTVFVVSLIVGKIYKIGILMYGKRPTVPELWRWLRY